MGRVNEFDIEDNLPDEGKNFFDITAKRIVWVDVVKYICILMVMLSHLEARTDLWQVFYTPFFLSAFFFVSGYVYKPKDGGFKKFLHKKIRQLFVPWLVFSVFNILLSQILSFNEHSGLLTELMWNFLQIRGKGDGIWFVAALFVSFIPFYFAINWYEAEYEKITGGVREIMYSYDFDFPADVSCKYFIYEIGACRLAFMEQ